MDIRLLGDVQVVSEGRCDSVSAPKVRSLLTCLALRSGSPCSTSDIIEALWPNDHPASAANLIQGYVSSLRKLLGPNQIRTTPGGYLLQIDEGRVDALKFRSLVDDARQASSEDAEALSRALRTALELWNGPAFGGTETDGPLAAAALSLNDLRLQSVEMRIRADLACGNDQGLVSELVQLVDANPYSEGLVACLALSLYRNGRQVESLRCVEAARSKLLADLGVSLGSELTQLEHQLLAQDPALDAPVPAPINGPSGDQRLRGRHAEMARLQDRFRSAVHGGQRTVFVGGEPGIGKSSIARALGAAATAAGHQVLLGRCDAHIAAPYRPFVEVVLGALRSIGPQAATELVAPRLEALVETIPSISSVLAGVDASELRIPELSLLDRFDTLSWVLQRITAQSPTVIVLEDVHWADSASIRFLHFVAVGHRLPGVLLLATHRTTEGAELLDDVLADLRSEPEVERLALGGLDEVALGELVGDRLGASSEVGFVSWVMGQTDGNPFLATELVNHVVATGSRLGLPDGVTEVVSRRLRRLSASAYRLLEYAAILGESGRLDVVRMVATDIDELPAALVELTTAGILVDDAVEDPAYRFHHAIIRSAVLGNINTFDRQDLHHSAANAWSQLPSTTETALELASHLWAAGSVADNDEAFAAFTRVAKHVDRSGARVEAVLWYDRALGLVSEDDPRHRTTRLTRFVAAQAAWHWVHGDA